ncbi:MAG: hypothetical protein HC927_11645 [Deltaproteobacteria bacterium]|nr:hypothetical protein [Deltaproteobacteria bacterium]
MVEGSERLLLLPHARRDGDIARELLANVGIVGEVCASVPALCKEIERGAGAAPGAEERLGERGRWPCSARP